MHGSVSLGIQRVHFWCFVLRNKSFVIICYAVLWSRIRLRNCDHLIKNRVFQNYVLIFHRWQDLQKKCSSIDTWIKIFFRMSKILTNESFFHRSHTLFFWHSIGVKYFDILILLKPRVPYSKHHSLFWFLEGVAKLGFIQT